MKICIIGHGRHGKDTLAEIWEEWFGLKFMSSSWAACELFLFDKLKDKYGYNTIEDCYNDRHNHREEWYNEICAYNNEDQGKLVNYILDNGDGYIGLRAKDEMEYCRDMFDIIIWVDASGRLPLESAGSLTAGEEYSDFTITNNGTLEEFTDKAISIGRVLFENIED